MIQLKTTLKIIGPMYPIADAQVGDKARYYYVGEDANGNEITDYIESTLEDYKEYKEMMAYAFSNFFS